MRWLTFRYQGRESFGVTDPNEGIFEANKTIVDLGEGSEFECLKDALVAEALDELLANASSAPHIPSGQVQLLPPIGNPDKILCVGLNYRDHQEETGSTGSDHPTIFVRFAEAQVGFGGEIKRPHESNTLDYEGEIALIIGKRGRRIPRENYLDYVFGFSCYLDGSVREFQRHTSQFTPGKNFDATGGFGPWIMTHDDIDDLDEMELITILNGERMQNAKASQMVFGFADLVEYCSTFTTLVPGDVIVTGTPGGVGAARNPPVFMDEGDSVSVTVRPIGTLAMDVVRG